MNTQRLDASVIICAHNPKPDFLARTLAALEAQTLSRARWELLLIDNNSTQPLAKTVSMSWHPLAQVVVESELGLTPARLRGVRDSRGELLVFVDDDNVLEPSYLERALEIARSHPYLGAFGAGIIRPEFEIQPASDLKPYLKLLALREETRAVWSNELRDHPYLPYGAGLCVRREVAERYARDVANSTLRRRLDRQGNSLSSSGDIDLALTACEHGLGTGVFPELEITHLIPAGRCDEKYLLRLAEAKIKSYILLGATRGQAPAPPAAGIAGLLRHALRLIRLSKVRRKFYLAERRGRFQAYHDLSTAFDASAK